MAARTSSQAGNWSSSSTWGGAAAPGSGDTATVNHAVAVDVNTTVGTSDGTRAVDVSVTGTLTVGAGITFTVLGPTRTDGTGDQFILSAGATLTIDPTADANGSANYKFGLQDVVTSGHNSRLRCNGTLANPCVVQAPSGRHTYFDAFNYEQGSFYARYTTFRRVGTAGVKFHNVRNDAGTDLYDFANCTFESCGELYGTDNFPAASISLVDCTWRDTPSGSRCLFLTTGSTQTAAVRQITGCVFDRVPTIPQWHATITGNVFLSSLADGGVGFSATQVGQATTISGNFNRIQGDTAFSSGDWTGNYLLVDALTYDTAFAPTNTTGGVPSSLVNAHVLYPGGAVTSDLSLSAWNCTDNVFDGNWLTGGQDIFGGMGADAGRTLTFNLRRNLFLKCSGSGEEVGQVTPNGTDTSNVVYEHNTHYVGTQNAIGLGDNYAGTNAGPLVTALRSNIVWTDQSAQATWAAGQQIIVNTVANNGSNASVAAGPGNWMTEANAGFNVTHGNISEGYAHFNFGTSGRGYNVEVSGAVGTTDQTGVNPGWVAPTRNLLTWIRAVDPSGTSGLNDAETYGYGLKWLAKKNDPDANPVFVIADLIAWVRAGYAPTNVSLKDAGHDSVTIGAVEGVWSSAATLPLVGGGLINGGLISGGLVA